MYVCACVSVESLVIMKLSNSSDAVRAVGGLDLHNSVSVHGFLPAQRHKILLPLLKFVGKTAILNQQ